MTTTTDSPFKFPWIILCYLFCTLQGSIPPVMAFNLGSLGFLTPFDFEEFKDSIESLLQGKLVRT